MSRLIGFFAFWYDFIIGDDWLTAAVIVAALGITGVLAHVQVDAWWLLPLVVILTLGISLWRLTRNTKSR